MSELWFTVILNLIKSPQHAHSSSTSAWLFFTDAYEPKCGVRAGRFVVVPVVVCVIVPRTETLQVREE